MNRFFNSPVAETDSEITEILKSEERRQEDTVSLIASENYVSRAVLEAQGSVLANKYAEGYPGHRYYGGCEFVDQAEDLARERLKALFGAKFVNVQPHCGSSANMAVFMAVLKPGEKVLGMSLKAGGHLTHGAKPSFSGKWFQGLHYGVREDGYLDYDGMERIAHAERPKLIIAGGSAYPRQIDFARFRRVADDVNAVLLADMSHFAGLVAAKLHPRPMGYADIVSSTTHKTLRGARGGVLLTNSEEWAGKLDKAIFPGIQGGALMHTIAAKAVSFGEALRPEFKAYQRQVIDNARTLAEELKRLGFDLVTGGTDTHLILVDLRPKNITGRQAETLLEQAGIVVNKNAIPNDPLPPSEASGIRLGSPAGTTRGFGGKEFRQLARWIDEVLTGGDISAIRAKVRAMCAEFPFYGLNN